MKSEVVLGLNFGDEGKGRVVSELIEREKHRDWLVARFSGGHQVGHTVMYDNKKHSFSNFGSGTLQGVPTYWSRFCTVDPVALKKEYLELKELDCEPVIYIDPFCPLVTPYDILYNKNDEYAKSHGSVGVGYGRTLHREEDHHHIYAMDILNPTVFTKKLDLLKEYYYRTTNINNFDNLNYQYTAYKMSMLDGVTIGRPPRTSEVIWEGSQGIMLDQEFGFFPHVTRAYTTERNIQDICGETALPLPTQVHYVTRAYLTRHGAGPMPTRNIEMYEDLMNIHEEVNTLNFYQGELRIGPLSIDLIKYAMTVNDIRRNNKFGGARHLHVTCTDQVGKTIHVHTDGGIEKLTTVDIPQAIEEATGFYFLTARFYDRPETLI